MKSQRQMYEYMEKVVSAYSDNFITMKHIRDGQFVFHLAYENIVVTEYGYVENGEVVTDYEVSGIDPHNVLVVHKGCELYGYLDELMKDWSYDNAR